MTVSQAASGRRETFGQRQLHTAPTTAMRDPESNSGPPPISNTKMQIAMTEKLLRLTCYGFIAVTVLIVAVKFASLLAGMVR
jgi:hypothetical protein